MMAINKLNDGKWSDPVKRANKWSDEKTIGFVQAYKSFPCLWNFGSEMYKDRDAKESSYNALSEQFELNVQEIKYKIKNLRSTYFQEMKKIKHSRKSNKEYSSKLIWFNEMSFLQKTARSAMTRNEMVFPSNGLLWGTEQKRLDDGVSSEENPKIFIEDEYDVFGKHVSQQLRKMDPCRAMRVEASIQYLLSKERLEELQSSAGQVKIECPDSPFCNTNDDHSRV
ncbi:PREDICTED: uncharacterized protein LOC108559975 isoform X2 [Nicrophorus vespilloides]|uniref:Uncharacterized protein LOC108559975 isoform X2 n=1 Tax=Nicrophorus vespilloides TaxID=110193 RepID=A0ABM1ME63_NICVS|nr:PREDICTED: uncharacterized protein LOC108559975 isoform X2 [Nicrophorus vespilloides]